LLVLIGDLDIATIRFELDDVSAFANDEILHQQVRVELVVKQETPRLMQLTIESFDVLQHYWLPDQGLDERPVEEHVQRDSKEL
jgi:hypothetical protein